MLTPEQRAEALVASGLKYPDTWLVNLELAIKEVRAEMRNAQSCGHPFACRVPTASENEGSAICSACVRELDREVKAIDREARACAGLMCDACREELKSGANTFRVDQSQGPVHGVRGTPCKAAAIRERMAKGGGK